MPVDPTSFALFLAAAFTICITPGPDMLYVLANGINQGSRAGVVAAFGMAAGMLCHTAAAAFGLSAVFAASPLAFEVVRYAGAAYLLWIGVRTLREPPFSGRMLEGGTSRLGVVFQRALVTNLLNPKIVIFYVAFLPQFVHAEVGPIVVQFLLLGFAFVVLGLVVDAAVGVLSGTLGSALVRSASLSRALNWLSGLIFVGLAVRLVVP